MFSFGSQTSPYDEAVEKATGENLMEENWALMMDITDKVSMEGPKGAKAVILSIKKRLNNRDPHVVIYALSLLDCLWKNAGVEFRRCVSSKDFIPELRDKSISSISAVALKTCKIIKEWSDAECAKDPSLALISSLYKELKENDLFIENNEPKKAKQVAFSKDPNVVSSAEEEAQLAQAIAASLNDMSIKKTQPASQYPSLSQSSQPANSSATPQSYREVKALYDFEAAEDNELSLRTGDIVTVHDDTDPNWWKGQSHRGTGLFPSSFVAGNEPETNGNHYTNGSAVETPVDDTPVQIDEEALLKCIELLEECDPTGETPDPPALAYFENLALQMAPLIDRKLANVDRQLNMLANVDIAMRDVLANYDQAVQQVQVPQMPVYGGYPQQQQYNNIPLNHQFMQQVPPQPSVSQPGVQFQQPNIAHRMQQGYSTPVNPSPLPESQNRPMVPPQPFQPQAMPVQASQPHGVPPQAFQNHHQQAFQTQTVPPQMAHSQSPIQINQPTGAPTQAFQPPVMPMPTSQPHAVPPQMPHSQAPPSSAMTPLPTSQSTVVPPQAPQPLVGHAFQATVLPTPQQNFKPTEVPQHEDHLVQATVTPIPQQASQSPNETSVPQQEDRVNQAMIPPVHTPTSQSYGDGVMPQLPEEQLTQAMVTPIPQQSAQSEARVPQHEEQLINLDDSGTSEPQPIVSTQALQQTSIVNPIPIAPQPHENQQFIASVQAQSQEHQT